MVIAGARGVCLLFSLFSLTLFSYGSVQACSGESICLGLSLTLLIAEAGRETMFPLMIDITIDELASGLESKSFTSVDLVQVSSDFSG